MAILPPTRSRHQPSRSSRQIDLRLPQHLPFLHHHQDRLPPSLHPATSSASHQRLRPVVLLGEPLSSRRRRRGGGPHVLDGRMEPYSSRSLEDNPPPRPRRYGSRSEIDQLLEERKWRRRDGDRRGRECGWERRREWILEEPDDECYVHDGKEE